MAQVIPSMQQYKANLVNGDQMYLDLRENMCHGIFYYGGQPHEYGTEKVFRKVLKHGDVVVDIGANVGYYTRIASKLVGSNGVVLAFEPMPAALRVLQMNCTDLSNAKLFSLALSDRESDAIFYVRKSGDMSSLSSDSCAKPIQVKTSTADNVLMNCAKIDFIKIDVEGFELEVIRGAHNILSAHKPIVYFEFLQGLATERGFQLRDFETLLDKYDYTLKWVNHTTAASIVSSEPTSYVIAVPNDRLHILY
jgi:FkbM family methyltransferase